MILDNTTVKNRKTCINEKSYTLLTEIILKQSNHELEQSLQKSSHFVYY
jgi:hypothetical protein